MKQLSPALQAHYQQSTQTLARCLRIAQPNGRILGLTEHDEGFVFEGTMYQSLPGVSASAVQTGCGLAAGVIEVEGLLSAAGVSQDALLAGLFDHAKVDVFEVNYEDLSQGKHDLFCGIWGEVQLQGGRYRVECRSLAQRLQSPQGELYSMQCRAQLGDARCRVPLQTFTHRAVVTEVLSQAQFIAVELTQAADYFTYGQLTWESGQNAATSCLIKNFQAGGRLQLQDPPPYSLEIGAAFLAIAGCNKSIATCQAQFNNAVNFRGEPFVPDPDQVK